MSFSTEVVDLDSELEIQDAEQFDAYLEPIEGEDFQALGIDPALATEAKPGSEDKVLMLSARYAAGFPLWHGADCYDHGPGATLVGADSVEGVKEEKAKV